MMPDKQRIAIFAHYDKDNIIDDYVIYYLNALKEVAQKIIFVSDCNLIIEEQNKLQDIVDFIITEKHDEYDFGSYKRGFLFALENNLLKDTYQCIFANDSCYGPFNSLKALFETMEQKECDRNCDFWGITQNKIGLDKKKNIYFSCKRPHLQSYFLVFKKNVFLSETFIEFIKSIKKEENKHEVIINYEIGLSEKLVNAGFKWESFIKVFLNKNSSIYKWDKIISNYNMPFLKCSLPKLKHQHLVIIDNYEKIIKQNSNYPVELIRKNVERTCTNKKIKISLPILVIFKFTYIITIILKKITYQIFKFLP